MQAISSRDVQKNYGQVIDRVTAGECVRVTRYGRSAFLMIPDTPDTELIMRKIASHGFIHTLSNRASSDNAKSLTQTDINQMIDECFL